MNYDQELSKITTKLEVHERRLTGLEKDIKDVIRTNYSLEKDLIVLQEVLGRVENNTEEIKDTVKDSELKWKELQDQRNRDHLEDPKKRIESMMDKVIFAVIGAVVMYLLSQAFPFLM